ncbi:MAG: transporter substrate-binding domain-containing protein [Clostridium sp.]|nr:transporter substrate-binding domain-containing protein [Clostridium sp.]
MKKKITVIVSIISIVFVMAFALAACNKETKPGYTALSAQADVFKELNAKTADVGIMDYTMANYLLSVDSAMAKKLTIADVEFEKEYYGIAFRKAADGKYNALTDLVNQTLYELKDTDYKTIAEKYGISAATLDLVYSKPAGEADNTELNYIKNKDKIVIGFTLNAPMALGSGDKTTGGFDTDLAKAVFAKISEKVGKTISVEFKLIEWSNKESEMKTKTIDCIWNGLTVTPARAEQWSLTMNYLENKQCAVIRKADKDKYNSYDALKKARIVAEDGSAGEDAAKEILGIK